MGGATSKQKQEEHYSLAPVPHGQCFSLSEHHLSASPVDRRDGVLFRIPGDSSRTVIQLDFPSSAAAATSQVVEGAVDWWQELRSQARRDRTIEVRLTLSLVDASREPTVRPGSYVGSGHKWPRNVFFEGELTTPALKEVEPDAQPSSSSGTTTVRFDKPFDHVARSAAVTLVLRPEHTNHFAHSHVRFVFVGADSRGDSFVRMRASAWERVTLPAAFDPRFDVGHSCVVDGRRLCQPVNQLSEAGVGGRHFEYIPLDEPNGAETAAIFAARWHATLEEARRADALALTSPPAHLEQVMLNRGMTSGASSRARTPRVHATPHASIAAFDRDWDAESTRSIAAPALPPAILIPPTPVRPAPVSVHLSARSWEEEAAVTAPPRTAGGGTVVYDPTTVAIHSLRSGAGVRVLPSASTEDELAGPNDTEADADAFLAQTGPHSDIFGQPRGVLRSPFAVPAPIPSDGLTRLRAPHQLPPLNVRTPARSPAASTATSPRAFGPRPDLHIHVANTPTPRSAHPASHAASMRNQIAPLPSSLTYDPFTATYAHEIDHDSGLPSAAAVHPFSTGPNSATNGYANGRAFHPDSPLQGGSVFYAPPQSTPGNGLLPGGLNYTPAARRRY